MINSSLLENARIFVCPPDVGMSMFGMFGMSMLGC